MDFRAKFNFMKPLFSCFFLRNTHVQDARAVSYNVTDFFNTHDEGASYKTTNSTF